MQQAVAQRIAFARVLLGVGIGGNFAGWMHHFIAAQHCHEVTPRRAPRLQQRVFGGGFAERVGAAAAQFFGQCLQIAPVGAGGRGQVKVQRADAGLGGDDAQHVGRDVERGEGEQPRWQALWQRLSCALEAREVIADAPRAVLATAGDAPPQDGLRVVRIGTGLPAQQPVAPPCLVFLEHAAQFASQRPRAQRVVAVQIGAQAGHRRLPHQRLVSQRRIQPPVQAGGTEVVLLAGDVALQRAGDELAGCQKFQIGGDAVFGSQRGLQPAPHRHLRYQHRVGGQQRLPRRGFAQLVRQQRGQHVQRVGVVEAEIRGVGHAGDCAAGVSQRLRPSVISSQCEEASAPASPAFNPLPHPSADARHR